MFNFIKYKHLNENKYKINFSKYNIIYNIKDILN